MLHPIMFRDDDPRLGEVRTIASSFPDAFEKVSHGRPAFFVSKMFAMYGGSVKPETKGDYIQYPHSIMVKVDESDRRALAHGRRAWGKRDRGSGAGWISPRGRRSTGARCAS